MLLRRSFRYLLLFLILFWVSDVSWAATATGTAGTATGTNWTGTGNTTSDDASYATYNNTGQNYLYLTNMGFSLPAGAIIDGITVLINGYGPQAVANRRQIDVGLTKDGSAVAGTQLTGQQLPQTDGDLTLGGASSLWGTTWSEAEVESSNFGVLIRDTNTTAHELDIDYVLVTVSYTIPAITVASSTSQPSDVLENATSIVLGSASIVMNTGTASVTAVTIKENSGTVDAQNDLSNVELWLSSDDTWDAGDNQLSTAQSFNGSDGTATFTETFTATTTPQYLIVRADMAAGATAGETIEVQFLTVSSATTVSGTPLDISGTTTVKAAITVSGTSNLSDGTTVKAATNATLQSPSATVTSGAWTINSFPQPSSGDIVTVWADGVADSSESTAVTKYDGSGNITGMVLDSNVLSIGSGDNQPLTVTNLGQYDQDNDEDIMHTANSGVLWVDPGGVYAADDLDILSGSTLTIGSTEIVDVHDVDILGTLTLSGSARAYVSGSWSNSGTFNANSSQVVATSNSAETITPGGSSFYDLNINDGLKAYYKFEETSSPALDSSGYGQSVEWYGSPSASSQVPAVYFADQRSILLSGADTQYLQAPYSKDLQIVGDLTIALWVYRNSATTVDNMVQFAGPAPDVEANNGLYQFTITATEFLTLEWEYGAGTNALQTSTAALSTASGAWLHLAVTRNVTTNEVKFYVNGSQLGTTVSYTNDPTGGTTSLLNLGRDVNGTNAFDGYLDDIRVYNRVLSATEIAALAAGTTPGTGVGTYTLEAALDVNNDLILNSGTLDVKSGSNYAITVGGDWENNGGIFTERTGAVTFDGVTSQILAPETFYNMTKNDSTNNAADTSLVIGTNTTITVAGTLSMAGTDTDDRVNITSSTDGTRHTFNVTGGNQSVSWVDVRDSQASSNNITGTNSWDRSNNDTGESAPHWILDGAPPASLATISSGTNQSFTQGDAVTAISPITVTDRSTTPIITAANDIRIRIPAAFNMTWDAGDTSAVITGGGSGKVSSTVSYEDSGKTLVLAVSSNFVASEGVTVSGLSFTSFSAPSSADNLELVLDGSGGSVENYDDKTITVLAPPGITVASAGQSPHEQAGTTATLAAASIVTDTGTATVTAVTFTEGGTIDASTELSNVKLWLSTDKVLDTGVDEQIGSTGTFSAANGTVTFSESFTVTTAKKYLFLQADIAAGASADTVEIELTSASSSSTVSGTPLTIGATTTVIDKGFFDTTWKYRERITFDNGNQATDITNVPVLVKLTTSRITYSHVSNANGYDLRFIDSNNSTSLSYHIESWNSSGDSYVWVKVPQVNGASILDHVWMYYGNSSISSSSENENDAFSNGYEMVHHFAQTSGSYLDSTVNAHNSSIVNVISRTNTRFGNAPSFDGTTADYVRIPDSNGFDLTEWTIEAWVRSGPSGTTETTGTGGIDMYPICTKGQSEAETKAADIHWFMGIQDTNVAAVDFEDTTTSTNDPLSGTTTLTRDGTVYYYIAATFRNSDHDYRIYVNGVSENNKTSAYAPNTGGTMDVGIATAFDTAGVNNGGFDGIIDEVRISTSARSADWLALQYLSGNDTLNIFGGEESAVARRRVLITNTSF